MGFVARNAFPLAAAALLVVAGYSCINKQSAQEMSLLEQQQRIKELQEDKTELEEVQDERERKVTEQVMGIDASRLDTDEEFIGQVLKAALTWESHAEYINARNTMMNVYGLDQDSIFMTEFLPAPPTNIDSEGTEYALINLLGLDSRVNDFRVEVLSAQGVEYTYLVLVDVQTTSDDGEASAYSTAAVLLTTDGNGGLSNIEGYASTSQVRSSGPY